jgi:hypothetical protein
VGGLLFAGVNGLLDSLMRCPVPVHTRVGSPPAMELGNGAVLATVVKGDETFLDDGRRRQTYRVLKLAGTVLVHFGDNYVDGNGGRVSATHDPGLAGG